MKKSSGRVGETEAHREEVTHPTSPSDLASDPFSLLSLSGGILLTPLCLSFSMCLFSQFWVSLTMSVFLCLSSGLFLIHYVSSRLCLPFLVLQSDITQSCPMPSISPQSEAQISQHRPRV